MSTMDTAVVPEISQAPTDFRRSVVLGVAILAVIAGIFWVDSRYPALLKKLHKGAAVQVNGALTFDNVMAVDRTTPLPQRVERTTINWLAANRVGMTFGFLFGAGALTLLPRFRKLSSTNPYKNALFGTIVGIPLGVCANCVAPIGESLYTSGVRKESALATMISSPTLNVVVLATLFGLFPLPVALLKVGLTLAILLIFLPWMASREPNTRFACKIAPESGHAKRWPHFPQNPRALFQKRAPGRPIQPDGVVPLVVVVGLRQRLVDGLLLRRRGGFGLHALFFRALTAAALHLQFGRLGTLGRL